MSRSRAALLLGFVLVASCTPRPQARALTVSFPVLRQGAVVNDVEFCQQLRTTLRFTDAGNGALAFPEQTLVPSEDNPCIFVMAAPQDVTRGVYDAEIRFSQAVLPDTCEGVANEIVIGMFARADIAIDEDNGLAPFDSEDEFFSSPADPEPPVGAAPDFDPDGDGLDNYAELRAGADPCLAGTAPSLAVTLTPSDPPEEGAPILFDLEMRNQDGADFLANIEITQTFDPSGTQRARWRSRTDNPSVIEDFDAIRPPDTEAWSFEIVSATAVNDGGADWQVRFIPEEPFVGSLTVRVFASFGPNEADVFAETVFSQTLAITEVPDQTVLRFVEEDANGNEVLVERDAVDFREVGPGVTPTAQLFVLSNGDVGSDEEDWDITLPAAATAAGVVLARDQGTRWRLTWNPDNAVFLANPGGLDVELTLVDDSNPAPVNLRLGISPLFNDAPTLVEPSVGARSLPGGDFISHSMPFSVVDPDQIDGAPTCVATLAPSGATPCAAPFDAVTCGVAGARAGDTWPMEIDLVPSATYAADCGSAPTFTLDITVTDVAPAGADPATPQTVSTAGLEVRTSQAIAPGTVTAPFTFTSAAHVFIDPNVDGALPARMGLGSLDISGGDSVLALYDLDVPEIVHTFERDQNTDNVCPNAINSEIEQREGVVDIVNHRALLYTRDCASDANLAVIVDIASRTTVPVLFETVCEPFNNRLSNPSVDVDGNFWFGCDTGSDTLVRLAPDGSFTSQTVDLGIGNDGFKRHALYTDAGGTTWYVWPDQDGVHLIDTADHANATPTMVDLPWPAALAAADDIEDYVLDTARDAYVFVIRKNLADDELWRVRFTGAPQLDGPLTLTGVSSGGGSNGGLRNRLLLKHPLAPTAGTDLVVSGGGDYVRPHIDLDTFAYTGERGATCTQDAECLMPGETCFLAQNICSDFFDVRGNGLFASPDRRFLVYPVDDEDLEGPGAWLYGWEPDDPRTLLVLGVPGGSDSSPLDTSVSREGFLMVIPDGGRVDVLYFVEAEQGLDQ